MLFTIQISDAGKLDEQIAVKVQNPGDLGIAAQMALDEVKAKLGSNVSFPLFIDIPPTADFENRLWMMAGQN